MLEESNKINVNVEMYGEPTSIEELQQNYAKVDSSSLYLDFE
jgi:hypothetical protein